MCDCATFTDLTSLLSPLPPTTVPADLYHGGCFPLGASLDSFRCGMWCSDTPQGAEQYARWGKQPGQQTGVIHVQIMKPVVFLLLPQYPLTFLKRYYGMNFPDHAIINRDLCCTLTKLGASGLADPSSQEWFLCHADQFATLANHTMI